MPDDHLRFVRRVRAKVATMGETVIPISMSRIPTRTAMPMLRWYALVSDRRGMITHYYGISPPLGKRACCSCFADLRYDSHQKGGQSVSHYHIIIVFIKKQSATRKGLTFCSLWTLLCHVRVRLHTSPL